MVHYCVRNSQPLDLSLSPMNQLHTLSPYLIMLHVYLSSHLHLIASAIGWHAQDTYELSNMGQPKQTDSH